MAPKTDMLDDVLSVYTTQKAFARALYHVWREIVIRLAFGAESLYPDAIHKACPHGGFGPRGAVAQLGERLVRNEEASGSIPLSSTIFSKTNIIIF